MIHSQRLLLVNEADVFLEFSCFFNDPMDVGNLISGSSAFSKSSLNIWNFSVHILLKPSLETFEHYFASGWNEWCNCVVVWTFFGTAFLFDWNENWHFPVLWPLLGHPEGFARLACVRHAASVHPEPGSNSHVKCLSCQSSLAFLQIPRNLLFLRCFDFSKLFVSVFRLT